MVGEGEHTWDSREMFQGVLQGGEKLEKLEV